MSNQMTTLRLSLAGTFLNLIATCPFLEELCDDAYDDSLFPFVALIGLLWNALHFAYNLAILA